MLETNAENLANFKSVFPQCADGRSAEKHGMIAALESSFLGQINVGFGVLVHRCSSSESITEP